MLHLKISEIILIHCDIVNKSYQEIIRVLYTFVANKSFGQLLEISSTNYIFLNILNSEFSCIEVWFTDQNYEHWRKK